MIMIHRDNFDIGKVLVSDADNLRNFDKAKNKECRTVMLLHLLEEGREAPLDMKDLEWLNYMCCI